MKTIILSRVSVLPVLFILIFYASNGVGEVGTIDEQPPKDVEIDPLDWFVDRSFRFPNSGYTACEQVFVGRGNPTHCKFGVSLYCAIDGGDLKACANSCDSIKSKWGTSLEQCHYGCLAAQKYSC